MRPPGHKVVESSQSSNRQPTTSTQQAAQLKVKSISYTRLPACPPHPLHNTTTTTLLIWLHPHPLTPGLHVTPLLTLLHTVGYSNWNWSELICFYTNNDTNDNWTEPLLHFARPIHSILLHSYLVWSPVLFVIRNVMPLFQIAKGAKKKKKYYHKRMNCTLAETKTSHPSDWANKMSW